MCESECFASVGESEQEQERESGERMYVCVCVSEDLISDTSKRGRARNIQQGLIFLTNANHFSAFNQTLMRERACVPQPNPRPKAIRSVQRKHKILIKHNILKTSYSKKNQSKPDKRPAKQLAPYRRHPCDILERRAAVRHVTD